MSILKSNYVVYAYLINCVDLSGYGIITSNVTPHKTLQSLKEIIKKEMQCLTQDVLKNYLSGLPSSIGIVFEYSEITQKLTDFGIITSQTPQSKIDKFVNNWFGVMGYRLYQLLELPENHKFFKSIVDNEFENFIDNCLKENN